MVFLFFFYFNLFLSFISIDNKASILMLLKPGFSIVFKSGPIRTQVSTTNHANSSLTSFFIRSLAVNSPTKPDRLCMLRVPNFISHASAFVVGFFTHMLEHITTSNVPCLWNLNFLNSNLGSILHKTKSFSKKTTLKSQNMISEIGRSKNSLYRFVMMTSPIIDRNKLALIAASSQPLTLHH